MAGAEVSRLPLEKVGRKPHSDWHTLSLPKVSHGLKLIGYLEQQVVGSSPTALPNCEGRSSVGRAAACRKAYPIASLVRALFSVVG
jgi:hypothetical protein